MRIALLVIPHLSFMIPFIHANRRMQRNVPRKHGNKRIRYNYNKQLFQKELIVFRFQFAEA